MSGGSDLPASLALAAVCVAVPVIYQLATGRSRFDRVEQQGGSFVLAAGLMHAGYWMLQPLIRLCVRARVSPAVLSWFSLVPAAAAALAAAINSAPATSRASRSDLFSTAKAEALRLTPPRGFMKRSDRLALLVAGALLTPASLHWFEPGSGPYAWPILAAVGLIAVFANLSAVIRLTALARRGGP